MSLNEALSPAGQGLAYPVTLTQSIVPVEAPSGDGAQQPTPILDHLALEIERPAVLIAEDDGSIAELLSELLVDAGYRVFVASNGRTALAITRRELPALVLSDFMMPEVDGMEFVRRLRASPVTHDIPVVMMSSVRPDRERMGDVPFLAKPFELDDVLQMIAQYARRSESEADTGAATGQEDKH